MSYFTNWPQTRRPPRGWPSLLNKYWLPTLDTLRNFFLLPTSEMLSIFQTMRDLVWWKINDSILGL